jgi:hypothetical protein
MRKHKARHKFSKVPSIVTFYCKILFTQEIIITCDVLARHKFSKVLSWCLAIVHYYLQRKSFLPSLS